MCHVTCGWGSLILSHHPATFGIHRPCESGNITPLIFHVTVSRVLSTWATTILSLGSIGFVKVEMFFICHVTTILTCHVTLWVESSHPKSTACYVWGPYGLWKRRYNVFYLSCDHDIEESRGFMGGVLSSYVTTLLCLGSRGLMEDVCISSNVNSNAEVYKWPK